MPPGPKDFSSGDKIKCEVDVELLTLASVAGEGADDQVLMVDHCGIYTHTCTCMIVRVLSSSLALYPSPYYMKYMYLCDTP